jgi:hypothetical protein
MDWGAVGFVLQDEDTWPFGKGRIVIDHDRVSDPADDGGGQDAVGCEFVVTVG